MSEGHRGSAYLPNVAAIADVIGILGFLGLSSTVWVRVAVTGALGVTGIVSAIAYLYGALGLYFSPRGAYQYPAAHRRDVFKAAGALVVGLVLCAAAVSVASDDHSQTKKTTTGTTSRGNAWLVADRVPAPDKVRN